MVAFDQCNHLGSRVTPMLAVYATATVVVTVAAGTRCAWYGLTGPLDADNRRQDPGLNTGYYTCTTDIYSTITVLPWDVMGNLTQKPA